MSLSIARRLFLLVVFSLPFVRPFATTIGGLRVPLTDFVFAAALLFWLAAVVRRDTRPRFDKLYIFIGLYGFALAASTVFSVAPRRSLFKLAGEFYLFALAVLALELGREERGFLKKIAAAWLAGTALTALASLAGFALFYLGRKTPDANYFLSHFGSLPRGDYPRIHALFANANMMCNYLNVSLMIALVAEKEGWIKKLTARAAQCGIWFAAVFTFSAGLGGMLLSGGLWLAALFKARGRRALARAALAGALAAAALVFASTLLSPDTPNTARDFALPFGGRVVEPSVRVLVWENALRGAAAHPFFGKGTGTDAALVAYETLGGDRQILLDAHNNWLNVLGQTGLFGLAAFLALCVHLALRCRFSADAGAVRLALSCAFAGAFLYQGLSGSFEDARHLWILFGLLAAASAPADDTSKASTAP